MQIAAFGLYKARTRAINEADEHASATQTVTTATKRERILIAVVAIIYHIFLCPSSLLLHFSAQQFHSRD